MTLGKASALAMGLIGAMALGVLIGPYITSSRVVANNTPAITESAPEPVASRPAAATRADATTRDSKASARAAEVVSIPPAPERTVEPSAPELHRQVKPLLSRGADMSKASEGFNDAEEFVTLVHASRNTEVPFVLLKHRVLTEGKTLAAAIRESKPEINAEIEAIRARAEAKSDLAKIGS
jgi:hypothetical protein